MSDAAAIPSPSTAAPVRKVRVNPIVYDGHLGLVYRIWLLNLLMKIITLGVYSFWGKTRMRKYLAAAFKLDDDRFEYLGTGMELFMGFLKAIPIFMLLYAPFMISSIFAGEEDIWPIIFLLPLFYFFGVARYAALRYRLSRTSWRGIRGYLGGSAFAYANLSLGRTLLNIVTLGFLIPHSDIARHRFITSHARFGHVPLEFRGQPGVLMKTHLITLLLAIPTLGLSRFWYAAALARTKVNGLQAGDLRFRCNVGAGNLIGLISINLLLVVFTLGLGIPITIQRNMKFLARHNVVGGDLKNSQLFQAPDQQVTVGEGLDDIFDLETGFL